ncbi:hypothetical protein DSM3645_26059 [Blastopirellula marina DSM 3645]|uniref:Uncharacterized protein n=1 Tax=Blastopirellula marina DSM 3645 TaxID=314230 RepID=A3ZWC5_9BACT|nr:hypothetical protein DSM3645_26059 [Blastopirellula marina DSM 3645]
MVVGIDVARELLGAFSFTKKAKKTGDCFVSAVKKANVKRNYWHFSMERDIM